MNLKIQIYSFIVSFVYGVFYYIMLDVNSKFICLSFKMMKIIYSFLFVIFMSLLFFIILLHLNNGYIHFYFFLCVILGYIVCKVVVKKIVNRK